MIVNLNQRDTAEMSALKNVTLTLNVLNWSII